MSDIKKAILQKLYETEQTYNVKIPLAIESGSRGWGFASPDSDYDCRFIYVCQKDWYVSITEKKDFIEYAADEVFDINGWDLKKAIQHIMKSNAVIFEWLSSNEIYIKNDAVTAELKALAEQYFNPIAVSYHYLSIAKNKLNEILDVEDAKLKKYFYILRPLANLCFIQEHMKMPHMEYMKTLSEISIDTRVHDEIMKLLEIKKVSNESYTMPQNEILINYFKQEIENHTENIQSIKFEKNRDYDNIDTVFRKIIEMVWRNE